MVARFVAIAAVLFFLQTLQGAPSTDAPSTTPLTSDFQPTVFRNPFLEVQAIASGVLNGTTNSFTAGVSNAIQNGRQAAHLVTDVQTQAVANTVKALMTTGAITLDGILRSLMVFSNAAATMLRPAPANNV
uniref:Uncharacterized protein n=1 Tax=Timema monikensis TaxID=170555 RepID=A0A7R9HVC7_9NEOP|nr:unnamed protein product [Timema monikensis]